MPVVVMGPPPPHPAQQDMWLQLNPIHAPSVPQVCHLTLLFVQHKKKALNMMFVHYSIQPKPTVLGYDAVFISLVSF